MANDGWLSRLKASIRSSESMRPKRVGLMSEKSIVELSRPAQDVPSRVAEGARGVVRLDEGSGVEPVVDGGLVQRFRLRSGPVGRTRRRCPAAVVDCRAWLWMTVKGKPVRASRRSR